MSDYKVYSFDLWEYLNDMPYMPSRQDRDELLEKGDDIHVQIWDYFFQIKPEDVGKPQKKEIDEINSRLVEKINRYTQRQGEFRASIKETKNILFRKRLRNFFYLMGVAILTGTICRFVSFLGLISSISLIYIILFVVITGLGVIVITRFSGWEERKEIKSLISRSLELQEEHNQDIKMEIKRRSSLEVEIGRLIRQIPPPPSGETVRSWLDKDLLVLWNRSKDETGLGTRLVDLNYESGVYDIYGNQLVAQNPIAVIGPAELQLLERIPQNFSKKINFDLYKHLKARRSGSYLVEVESEEREERVEVLYGVYYLEHILIGDDMLATYGFFFDFITGKLHAEQITEQYYKDVVAISIFNEFRSISLDVDTKKPVYIEDAPTFTLSLASSEQRIVTFVNEKYFMKIKDRIGISEDQIVNIIWIEQSRLLADNAIKALRHYVRLHKGTI